MAEHSATVVSYLLWTASRFQSPRAPPDHIQATSRSDLVLRLESLENGTRSADEHLCRKGERQRDKAPWYRGGQEEERIQDSADVDEQPHLCHLWHPVQPREF